MPTFKSMKVRSIPRKDKSTLFIGHNNDGEFFLSSNDPVIQQNLLNAATSQNLVDIDSSSFQKPQLGSMFVQSIQMKMIPSGLNTPLIK